MPPSHPNQRFTVPAHAEISLELDGVGHAVPVLAVSPTGLLVPDVLEEVPVGSELPIPSAPVRWPEATLVLGELARPLGELAIADISFDGLWLAASSQAGRALLWDICDAIATGRIEAPARAGDAPDAHPGAVPRRGHYTEHARRRRLHWAREATGAALDSLDRIGLDAQTLAGNVENLVGTVEIPVGLAGPLRFDGQHARGWLVAPLATTEGALVASASRGARAISRTGAVRTHVLRQRMSRAPLYELADVAAAARFGRFALAHLDQLREQVRAVSAHAQLIELVPIQTGRSLHLQFVYETADAAGQNMTTAATWHAARWLRDLAVGVPGLAPRRFYLDGNSSGDKKLTHHNLMNTRGARVTAECLLDNATIKDVLKITPREFVEAHHRAVVGGQLSGMVGYNINVANVIAAIFTATGQDIACVHESGSGILAMERLDDGVYVSLLLPGVVVGTVGGGTALPNQSDYLDLLGCGERAGESHPAERLAEAIAGFALALEISTCAAMAGGQFADAHERLGRNRPVEWFTAADLTPALFTPMLAASLGRPDLEVAGVSRRGAHMESGTVSELTAQTTAQKLVGVMPLSLTFTTGGAIDTLDVVLKSKPLDTEVMLTMNKVASLCGGGVAEAFSRWRERVGFEGSHTRELGIYRDASLPMLEVMPTLFGVHEDPAREAYLLVLEDLTDVVTHGEGAEDIRRWMSADIDAALIGIAGAHASWLGREEELLRQPWLGQPPDGRTMASLAELWHEIAIYAAAAFPHWVDDGTLAELQQAIADIPSWWQELEAMPRTLVHNDFSPRNIALRRDGGRLVAFDWELATLHVPQRDLAELMAFVMSPNVDAQTIAHHVETHRQALEVASGTELDPVVWRRGYRLALRDFLLSRLSLFIVAHAERSYAFLHRVVPTVRRLVDIELEHDRIHGGHPSR
jgi:NADP-dependent 3-hydroxy-3-methylglutaryl-CoA reductase